MSWSIILKLSIKGLLARKMVMFYMVLTVLFVLSIWNKITGDNIIIALGWIITNFVIGNVGEWRYKRNNLNEMNVNGKD